MGVRRKTGRRSQCGGNDPQGDERADSDRTEVGIDLADGRIAERPVERGIASLEIRIYARSGMLVMLLNCLFKRLRIEADLGGQRRERIGHPDVSGTLVRFRGEGPRPRKKLNHTRFLRNS